MKYVGVVLGVIIVILFGFTAWFTVNGLNQVVALHENVQASWAQVENQLKRRNDLIPNLVNTVKGYASHEKEVFEKVTELRGRWEKAVAIEDKIKTAKEMVPIISRLLMSVEDYPELKANQNFLTLQAQLESTENRIAVERMRYNQAVLAFNVYIRSVFGNIFAKIRNLTEPAIYFEIEEKDKELPKIDFK